MPIQIFATFSLSKLGLAKLKPIAYRMPINFVAIIQESL
ncbi:MAG: hypothetical protein ACI9JM_002105 [Halioglobus sp.]